MISIKQLKYALAVEKTLHFKKAAEACYISQSALSTAISELESQLGLQLFERDNKKVIITPKGKEVLQHARSILAKVEELEHLADNQKTPLSYPISVGMIPTIAPFLLPSMFPILNKQYPNAQIRVVEEQSTTLVDLVMRGEIDTAVLALPFPCEGLLTMEFWQEDFYCITQKNDGLAKYQGISSTDIDPDRLMLLSEGHCLTDHTLGVCKFSDRHSRDRLGATNLTTLIQLVAGGLGTTLVPAMATKQLISHNKKLSAVHLDEPGPHRRIAFIVRPKYTRMSSVEALIDICKDSLS